MKVVRTKVTGKFKEETDGPLGSQTLSFTVSSASFVGAEGWSVLLSGDSMEQPRVCTCPVTTNARGPSYILYNSLLIPIVIMPIGK